MKHCLQVLVLLACLTGVAQAQVRDPYLGGGLFLVLPYDNLGSSGFSFQSGATVIDELELRLSADLWWVFMWTGVLSLDALYAFPIQDDLDLYLGAGPNLRYSITSFSDPTYTTELDVSAVLGMEYNIGDSTGIFAEYRASVLSSIEYQSLLGWLRTGVNFYF